MEFKHYNPEKLALIFQERGITSSSYSVCQGCVFTNVPPEDCIHPSKDMKASSVQSDLLCPHCYITAEESQETFPIYADKTLVQKVAELETIIEMSCSS